MLKELEKIGLSENEAKVYSSLLDLGNATVQQIAKKTRIPRPTIYVQLESLMRKGIVATFEKGSRGKKAATKTYFRAEDPIYLKKIVEQEKSELNEKEKVLRDVLPDLAKIFNFAGERPRVRFFEGVEGLKTIQD